MREGGVPVHRRRRGMRQRDCPGARQGAGVHGAVSVAIGRRRNIRGRFVEHPRLTRVDSRPRRSRVDSPRPAPSQEFNSIPPRSRPVAPRPALFRRPPLRVHRVHPPEVLARPRELRTRGDDSRGRAVVRPGEILARIRAAEGPDANRSPDVNCARGRRRRRLVHRAVHRNVARVRRPLGPLHRGRGRGGVREHHPRRRLAASQVVKRREERLRLARLGLGRLRLRGRLHGGDGEQRSLALASSVGSRHRVEAGELAGPNVGLLPLG
mmetsp:Transcript_7664/g.33786  ORF Transcript_7664/g.33786 Transcript_7664/m.33786 type:complete len:267 (+) Transcript_7664:619-1419(+)